MRRLLRLAPLVAASFVAGVVVPRATVWRHHHDGGEHAHVHLDEAPDHDQHHHDDELDHHHHHHHDDHDDGPGVAAPEPFDHTHVQQPFVRADRPPAPHVVRTDRIAWLPASHAGPPVAPSRPAPRSRGPPRA